MKTSPHCYQMMFMGSGLRAAPALPATELAGDCYTQMFSLCELEKAPQLPASSLETRCYAYMFSGCSRLVQAPVLPAEKLVEGCYQGMFQGNTSLRLIEVHATDRSAPDCTTNWLLDASSQGTLVCRAGADWLSDRSYDGLPKGWEVSFLSP